MSTALITHPDCHGHVTPDGHPEQAARLKEVLRVLAARDLVRETAPIASDADLCLAHPKAHVAAIRAKAPQHGTVQLDPDTWMSPGSLDAALRAAGAAVRAVDMVLAGEVTNAFVATRPPGHHAERETPMGFCLFGNVAIAAKHALERHGLSRVAIVDFDVHHGNGTDDLVREDERILFISTHEMPLYPGTGDPKDTGPHDTVMNIALSTGTDGSLYRKIMDNRILPRLREFKPELILISAGFDAHADDPLAGISLSTDDFGWITSSLTGAARDLCGGRIVSCLEGGYDLAALGASAAIHVDTLIAAGA